MGKVLWRHSILESLCSCSDIDLTPRKGEEPMNHACVFFFPYTSTRAGVEAHFVLDKRLHLMNNDAWLGIFIVIDIPPDCNLRLLIYGDLI